MDLSKIGEDKVSRKLAKKEPNLSLIWKASNFSFWATVFLLLFGIFILFIALVVVRIDTSTAPVRAAPNPLGILYPISFVLTGIGGLTALLYSMLFFFIAALRRDYVCIAISAGIAGLLFMTIYWWMVFVLPLPMALYKHFRLKRLVLASLN